MNHLQNPTLIELDDAYRSLPRLGEITIITDPVKLPETLKNLENTGFIAIQIAAFTPQDPTYKLRAFKGKHGPCYDTGRKAHYTGTALAALDDDNHLLLSSEESPVCEKTANIYSLEPYLNLVRCTGALESKLTDEPEYFNCNTFEEDQEKLFRILENQARICDRTLLFYPGPYRLLILADGTIVRRGRLNSIPVEYAKDLNIKENLFQVENWQATEEYFQDVYKTEGSKWLLNEINVEIKVATIEVTDYLSLQKISPQIRKRLWGIIKNNKNYFILTGSDPSDQLGCCPSEDVAEANRLVKAGILSSYSQVAYGDVCPVTIYALKGEMKWQENEMQFSRNEIFRELVLNQLENRKKNPVRLKIKWILLLFVAISIILALKRLSGSFVQGKVQTLYEQLAPTDKNQILILLFHFRPRCSQCLNMEKFTESVLKESYQKELETSEIQFKLVEMDSEKNQNLVKRFGLFTTTIVLVRFENAKEKNVKVLKDAFKLFDNEEGFKSMMRQELSQFLADNHE